MTALQSQSGKDLPKAMASKSLIVGLGKTGLSCARYLTARGVPVAVTDTREVPPCLDQIREELPDIALFLGGFQEQVFEAADQLVVSPGVAVSEPLIQAAKARGVPIVGDIELFAQVVKAPMIAITGSNGKSTVTTMLGDMVRSAGWRVAIGGNLGETALDLLDDAVQLYILELSSFQLETTDSLKPNASVVLNVSPDHMDRYANLDDYANTKAKIYHQAAIAVVNLDDDWVKQMLSQDEAHVGFTLEIPDENDFGLRDVDGNQWLCCGEKELMPATDLLIPGRHNLANALAALALGRAVGLPQEAMLEALRAYTGLSHRTAFVCETNGVRWYNDSKGTNVGATKAALDGLYSDDSAGRIVLIAGGECKDADFTELLPIIKKAVRAVVLIGRDAGLLEDILTGRVTTCRASDMSDAVGMAAELAESGDLVLLSPACASFDMFKNYEARGDAFVAAVRVLR